MTDATALRVGYDRDCPHVCGFRVRHNDEAGAASFLREHLQDEHPDAAAPAMIWAAPDLRYGDDAVSAPAPDCQCDRCLGIAAPGLAAEVNSIIAIDDARTPCDRPADGCRTNTGSDAPDGQAGI